MISVQRLTKRYASTVAVDTVSFDIPRGEVVGFLGPNGAGKTTTLRMLSGYLPPTAGTATLAGYDVAREGLEVRRRIGYLAEGNPLYDEMDVAEYLEWSAAVRGLAGPDGARRIRAAAGSCGLGDVLGKAIGLLSKGYRQRVGLAAAILHDPEIILLDEPTSGLDPNQAHEVRELIRGLKREKTVLLSTHILSEVQAACDRVLIIHRGKIAASGSPAELTRQAAGACVLLAFKAGEAPEGELREALAGLPGVREARPLPAEGESRWSLAVEPEADAREAVFRLAVDKRWTLLELRREEASLESVFRELTR